MGSRKRPKGWMALLLFLCFGLILSACGKSPSTQSSASPSAEPSSTPANSASPSPSAGNDQKQTIKVAYQKFGTPPIWGEEWLKKVKAQFESQNPNVTVQLVPIQASENDFYTKLDLMMKSGDSTPDVVTEDTFLINSDAAAGYLDPLNDKVASWEDWSNFPDAMKKGGSSDNGTVYGIPYSTDTRGLWYNTEIFKKAGLPVPWEPKNWNDIMTAAQTIKQKAPGVIPFWTYVGKATGEATTMQCFEMFLYGTNDTLYDAQTKKWVVKSPGFLDSLTFISNIFKNKLGPQLSQILNAQAGNMENTQLMPKGKIAIALDGNWIPGAWVKNGSTPWPDALKVYNLAAMPTQNGQAPGYTSMSGGWTLSVTSKSKVKDLAWKFIQLATNKDNNKWLTMKQGNLSPRSDVAQDPEYQNTPGQAFAQATAFTKFTHFRPANTQYPAVSTQIQTVVEAVATGALTPQKAMDQYAQSVERIVGKNNVETK